MTTIGTKSAINDLRHRQSNCRPSGNAGFYQFCLQNEYSYEKLIFSIKIKRDYFEGGEMTKEFTVIIEKDDEGHFIAEVPELKGCHTQAKSLDTLMERIKEAILLCLEEYGEEHPVTHLVGVQKVAV
jgi:predicted RNase H-like HicB family nuclease